MSIGESMRNLSDLIDKHEEIYGDQSQRITYLPSMSELRMTNDEKIGRNRKEIGIDKNKELVKKQREESKKQKSGI